MDLRDWQTGKQGTVVFLHIPKAAGTTLHWILERQYRPREIFDINGRQVKESIQKFIDLPLEQRSRIRLLQGHMPFGLHEFLPNPSVYITMLRDLVHRVISHYYYVLRIPVHYLYKQVVSQRMSLEDYVCSGISKELDNGQTRHIAGIDYDIGFGQCPEELLERAIDNLQNYFAVVGLVERFDESLILMKNVLGWSKMPFYVKRNVTKNGPADKSLTQEVIRKIQALNEVDPIV